MSGGFVKLSSSILDSSIWSEPPHVCKLWITMLAMCDREGQVMAAVPGLSRRSGLSLADTQQALAVLEAPDEFDRSGVDEGRRIRKVQGGWLVTNYKTYREHDYSTERVRAHRERKRNETAETVSSFHGVAGGSSSASASAFASGREKGVPGEEGWAYLPDDTPVTPVLREKLEPYARESRLPVAFWTAIGAEMNGLHGRATEAEMLRAVADMQANGDVFNISRLRGYLRKNREHDNGPRPRLGDPAEPTTAAVALSQIVQCIKTVQVPGRGEQKRLAISDVQALGKRHYDTLLLVGGVARVLADHEGKAYSFLLRDFEKEWAAVARVHDASA